MKQAILKFLEKLTKPAPLLFLALWLHGFYQLFKDPGFLSFLWLACVLYILPPVFYRFFALFIPLRSGVTYISNDSLANGWVVAHRFQIIYHCFEGIERILRLVPGGYSAWLRLWGSKIGKKVYWTPHTKVGDRTHLEIGDHVFIGNATYISPHVAKLKGNRFMLLIDSIKIESNSFIGTHCTLGPGAHLKQGEVLPAFSALMGRKAKKIPMQDIELGAKP